MAYTLDTKVGDLLQDSKAIQVLEKRVPGITSNPMIGLAKGMTLRSLLAMPQVQQAGVNEKMITDVLNEINALKK